VEELVCCMEPKIVLVLGIAPFDVHAQDTETVLMDRSGRRRLLVAGRIAGQPAIGILHPTGAQVAGEDWSPGTPAARTQAKLRLLPAIAQSS
jgi:hypothetical protein